MVNRKNMPELEAALWLYSKQDFDDGLVRDAALAIRELTKEYLKLCEGDMCGDSSVGIPECRFRDYDSPKGCRLQKNENSEFYKACKEYFE